MQNENHENRVFYAAIYSQLDKHVSGLAASAINDDRRCRSRRYRRWFGRTSSPASKAFQRVSPASPDVFSINGLDVEKRPKMCSKSILASFLISPPRAHLLIYLLKTEQYQHLAIQNVR